MDTIQHLTAADLMVGDWVMAEYGNQDNRPASISGLTDTGGINLNFQNGMCLVTNLNRNRVEPIPLTPEILEKNGFAEDDYDDCWGDANCFFIPNYADKNIISWETHIELTNGRGDFSGNLTYVHELQHVLKLCGIDKEIRL